MDKRRILVIDDEKDVCDLIKSMLETRGYETLTALDGEEGLEKAATEQPDLVLLDIVLPGINGFEVLNRLKRNLKTQHIPIIMVSAKRDYSFVTEASNLRAVDYVMKPFTAQELFKIISRSLSLFHFPQGQIDAKLISEICRKLQTPKTALEELSKNKKVPKGFIDEALKDLDEATRLLKKESARE